MYKPRLKTRFNQEIIPAMMKRFGYKNPFEVPRILKIVLNVSMGDISKDPKLLESVQNEIAVITGQRPAVTKSKKAVSGFKLRKGMVIGCKVTLRRSRMYEFLDRLVNIAVPRIRDFRGLDEASFDGRGNYSFGIKEQGIFPEVDIDKVARAHGMDVTIATDAGSDTEALELLKMFGMPFKKI